MCNESQILQDYSLILLICSIISGLSSIIIICLFLYVDKLKGLSFKILFYMAISDLLRSIALILNTQISLSNSLCIFIACVINCTFLMIGIWSVYIIYILFRIYSNFPLETNFYVKTWTCIGFIGAPLFQLIPLSTESYGFNDGSCTYKNNTLGIIWRGFEEISMLLAIAGAVVACYVFHLKKNIFENVKFRDIVFEKGLVYSFIFFVTLTAVLMFRYLEMVNDFCDVYVFGYISFTCSASHGFFNFIALVLNKSFRTEINYLIIMKKSRNESIDIVKKILQSSESSSINISNLNSY